MVLIYSGKMCPYCDMAKDLLDLKKIPFVEKYANEHMETFQALAEKHHHRTVPMIFINDEFIGGYDDLVALNASGELEIKTRG